MHLIQAGISWGCSARGGFPDFGIDSLGGRPALNRPTAGQGCLVVSSSPCQAHVIPQAKNEALWEEACFLETSSRRQKRRDCQIREAGLSEKALQDSIGILETAICPNLLVHIAFTSSCVSLPSSSIAHHRDAARLPLALSSS